MSIARPLAIPGIAARVNAQAMVRAVAPYLLITACGIELATLCAWLPDTMRLGWNHPTGDFRNLYEPARDLDLVGLYSPFLAPLLHPLTWLGELNAFRAFFVLNCAAMLAIAGIAQSRVRSLEAKCAVALGVLSVPQLHWAARMGHLTPMLALVALAGLMLVQRKPRAGALVLSILSFKPQYAVAPFILLLRERRWHLAGLMFAAACAMAMAGFLAIGLGEIREYLSIAFDWGPDSRDNLLPVQQSWLYSWPGVQISAGFEPHPLVTFQLIGLSLLTVVLAWVNTDAPTRACVAAFAMLLLTPYAQFYDFGLIVVGMVLLLSCRFDARLKASIWSALWLAALVTQDNTIFPSKDLLGAATTDGFYWLTPAVLATVAVIAVAGKLPRRRIREARDGD
jgi:hypothetical protein